MNSDHPNSSNSNTESTSVPTNNNISQVNNIAVQNEDSGMVVVRNFRDPTLRPMYRLSVKLIDTYKHINKVEMTDQQNYIRVNIECIGILRSQSKENTRSKCCSSRRSV
jgi:hypothetical protein